MMRFFLLVIFCVFSFSDAISLQRYTIRCDIASVGGENQSSIIKVIRNCINKDDQTSFYSMHWLEKQKLEAIFNGISSDSYELIIILNGADENYLNKSLRHEGDFYLMHRKIVDRNKERLRQLLDKFGIESLTDECVNLRSIDGCYAKVREELELPTLARIKYRVYFLLNN